MACTTRQNSNLYTYTTHSYNFILTPNSSTYSMQLHTCHNLCNQTHNINQTHMNVVPYHQQFVIHTNQVQPSEPLTHPSRFRTSYQSTLLDLQLASFINDSDTMMHVNTRKCNNIMFRVPSRQYTTCIDSTIIVHPVRTITLQQHHTQLPTTHISRLSLITD